MNGVAKKSKNLAKPKKNQKYFEFQKFLKKNNEKFRFLNKHNMFRKPSKTSNF